MKSETAGAWALIFGSLAGVTLMALHPTHTSAATTLGPWTMNSMVHATAIFSTPILFFGTLALSRFLGADRPLVQMALVFYGFASVAIIGAATMSGLVMQQLMEAAQTPGARDTGVAFQSLAQETHWINQGFAHVYTSLASIAVLLWSIAWRGWIVRIIGLALSLAVLAWQLSGTMTLDIHGMGAVVLSQMIWMVLVAAMMLRKPSAAA